MTIVFQNDRNQPGFTLRTGVFAERGLRITGTHVQRQPIAEESRDGVLAAEKSVRSRSRPVLALCRAVEKICESYPSRMTLHENTSKKTEKESDDQLSHSKCRFLKDD